MTTVQHDNGLNTKRDDPNFVADDHDSDRERQARAMRAKAAAAAANGGDTSGLIACGSSPELVEPISDDVYSVQPLKRAEMQPSYAQDLGVDYTGEHGTYGSLVNCCGSIVGGLGVVPCCPCPSPFKQVSQGSVGLVSRFGKFYKSVDPGLVKINVLSESLRTVDVKIQIVQVPRQTVMTKDNVQISIDSVLVWHIVNPYKAAFGIADVRLALVERAQTTLRQIVGARTLQSVVTEREAIALEIEEIIESVSEKIQSILLKDIVFSEDLQASLSSAAQQKRIGESKVIAARAEVDSARLMREAADILSSPAAIQIRQLEALQQMARQANSKVIFVPMSLSSMGTAEASRMMNNSGDNAIMAGPAGQAAMINAQSSV